MKLFLLVGENLGNSDFYNDKLNKIEVDIIYSSPDKNAIFSIYKHANKNNLDVNVDYSLSKFNTPLDNNEFNIDEKCKYRINQNFISVLEKTNIYFPEDINLLKNRIFNFINTLDNNQRILLVSHNIVINCIIRHFITDYDINTIINDGNVIEVVFNDDNTLIYL